MKPTDYSKRPYSRVAIELAEKEHAAKQITCPNCGIIGKRVHETTGFDQEVNDFMNCSITLWRAGSSGCSTSACICGNCGTIFVDKNYNKQKL